MTTELQKIQQQIRSYEKQYSRSPHSVSLLAVSKHQSLEKMLAVIAAGQHAFGENYLQEALTKITALKDYNIEWHFIGPIQTNKTKKIAEYFAWVQSVSSAKIAQRLNDQRPAHLPPLNICLQVNISHEQTKSGVDSNELFSLAKYCASLSRLTLRGLMAIPAPKDTFAEQAAEYHKLRLFFNDLSKIYPNMDTLSMGMSNDLAAAIAEGSTMVRIGTALFGSR